ncbi:MAG: hypothetical protein KC561_14710, partial [Myxococcales bacterium]|nr:hypothetical protein [Myxococcales bacterium]
MRRSRRFRRLVATLWCLPLTWLMPPAVFADDLTFDPDEEAFEVEELDIDPDDVPVLNVDSDLPLATGLVIPDEDGAISPDTAEILSDLLLDQMETLGVVAVTDNYELEDEFDVLGAEFARECAF